MFLLNQLIYQPKYKIIFYTDGTADYTLFKGGSGFWLRFKPELTFALTSFDD